MPDGPLLPVLSLWGRTGVDSSCGAALRHTVEMTDATLDLRRVARQFGAAASSYDRVAVLQREVGSRLLERLVFLDTPPTRVLDVGTGTGAALPELSKRYPQAALLGLDLARPMLKRAERHRSWLRRVRFELVQADARALPLADACVDLLHSNLCLQWVDDLPALFNGFRRVLKPGAWLMFSSFGPDTLRELREAFASVDDAPHIHRFLDLHDVGDRLLAAGFRDPVLDVERFTLRYAEPREVLEELKALGARNAMQQRAPGLMTPRKLKRVLEHYAARREADGKVPATWEVIYAMARAPGEGQPIRQGDREVATFSLEALKRTLRR
jgi:malonyl-CoA O-methyltransferase